MHLLLTITIMQRVVSDTFVSSRCGDEAEASERRHTTPHDFPKFRSISFGYLHMKKL